MRVSKYFGKMCATLNAVQRTFFLPSLTTWYEGAVPFVGLTKFWPILVGCARNVSTRPYPIKGEDLVVVTEGGKIYLALDGEKKSEIFSRTCERCDVVLAHPLAFPLRHWPFFHFTENRRPSDTDDYESVERGCFSLRRAKAPHILLTNGRSKGFGIEEGAKMLRRKTRKSSVENEIIFRLPFFPRIVFFFGCYSLCIWRCKTQNNRQFDARFSLLLYRTSSRVAIHRLPTKKWRTTEECEKWLEKSWKMVRPNPLEFFLLS